MKSSISSAFFLVVLLFAMPIMSLAQPDPKAPKVLACPFEHGSGREPKEAFTWNPPDQKVIMISHQDSIVRACVKGKVVTVTPAEEDHYEIVINTGDYYFWYYAVARPTVTRGQSVEAGQSIAIYKMGSELEFRMYKFEDMMDPRSLLECKIPKAD